MKSQLTHIHPERALATADVGVDERRVAGELVARHAAQVSTYSEHTKKFMSGHTPTFKIANFINDNDVVSNMYLDASRETADALAEQYEPLTPAKRLLIETATAALVDSMHYARAARHRYHAGGPSLDAVSRAVERYAGLANRSSKVLMAALEALARPGPSSVSVRIHEASNVALGPQLVQAAPRSAQ